ARGRCVVNDGQAVCVCDPGHSGERCGACAPGYESSDAGDCVLGDACAVNVCSGHGSCVDGEDGVQRVCEAGVTGPRCTHCADGYHGEGSRCVPDETCTRDSCSGSGACSVVGGRVECACERGYAGARCELTCLDNDCNGNGTCAEVDG